MEKEKIHSSHQKYSKKNEVHKKFTEKDINKWSLRQEKMFRLSISEAEVKITLSNIFFSSSSSFFKEIYPLAKKKKEKKKSKVITQFRLRGNKPSDTLPSGVPTSTVPGRESSKMESIL